MRLVVNTPRRTPLALRLWEAEIIRTAVLSGTPTHIVASSRAQAEKTYEAAVAFLNGRDPKALSG